MARSFLRAHKRAARMMKDYPIGPHYDPWRNMVLLQASWALLGSLDAEVVTVSVGLADDDVTLHFLYSGRQAFHARLRREAVEDLDDLLLGKCRVRATSTYGVPYAQWRWRTLDQVFRRYEGGG